MQRLSEIFPLSTIVEGMTAWTVERYGALDHETGFFRVEAVPNYKNKESFDIRIGYRHYQGAVGIGADPMENPWLATLADGIQFEFPHTKDSRIFLERLLNESDESDELMLAQVHKIDNGYLSVMDGVKRENLEVRLKQVAEMLFKQFVENNFNPDRESQIEKYGRSIGGSTYIGLWQNDWRKLYGQPNDLITEVSAMSESSSDAAYKPDLDNLRRLGFILRQITP